MPCCLFRTLRPNHPSAAASARRPSLPASARGAHTDAERRSCLKTSGARSPEQVSFLHRRFLGKQRHRAPPCRLEQRDGPHAGQPTVPSRLGSDVPWCCWAGSDPGGIQAAASCLSSSGPDVKGQPDRPLPELLSPLQGAPSAQRWGVQSPRGPRPLEEQPMPPPQVPCVSGTTVGPTLVPSCGLASGSRSV